MAVKGVAFLARQMMVVQEHGEQAWRRFLTDLARREPFFERPVMPVTRIPVDAFLRLNDELVQDLYSGDPKVYWQFGVKSAEYALLHGQLRAMFAPGDLRRFLQFTPGIWKGYFTEGELTVHPETSHTDLRIVNAPRSHIYFELSVMGFAAGGLQLLGARSLKHEPLKGFTKGNKEVLYRFRYE